MWRKGGSSSSSTNTKIDLQALPGAGSGDERQAEDDGREMTMAREWYASAVGAQRKGPSSVISAGMGETTAATVIHASGYVESGEPNPWQEEPGPSSYPAASAAGAVK